MPIYTVARMEIVVFGPEVSCSLPTIHLTKLHLYFALQNASTQGHLHALLKIGSAVYNLE